MNSPEFWFPFPDRTDVYDRAFRIELENSANPVLKTYIERAYKIGDEVITKRLPELDSSISMEEASRDSEIAPLLIAPFATSIKDIAYVLWNRKINAPAI